MRRTRCTGRGRTGVEFVYFLGFGHPIIRCRVMSALLLFPPSTSAERWDSAKAPNLICTFLKLLSSELSPSLPLPTFPPVSETDERPPTYFCLGKNSADLMWSRVCEYFIMSAKCTTAGISNSNWRAYAFTLSCVHLKARARVTHVCFITRW